MQAALERRGKELLGICLLVLGVAVAMMFLSYSPEDPSFLAATDAPVRNWLGRYGAMIAAPVFMIMGWASVGVAVVLLAWGARLVLHRVPQRGLGRVVFAPIAIALLAIHASTLATGSGWAHSFGLGGLFGDTVLSIALTMLPIPTAWALKLVSVAAGLGVLVVGAFVLGFTRGEVRTLGRLLVIGVVLAYSLVLQGLTGGTQAVMRGGKACAQGGRPAAPRGPRTGRTPRGQARCRRRRHGAPCARADARRYEDFDPVEDAEGAAAPPKPAGSLRGCPGFAGARPTKCPSPNWSRGRARP